MATDEPSGSPTESDGSLVATPDAAAAAAESTSVPTGATEACAAEEFSTGSTSSVQGAAGPDAIGADVASSSSVLSGASEASAAVEVSSGLVGASGDSEAEPSGGAAPRK